MAFAMANPNDENIEKCSCSAHEHFSIDGFERIHFNEQNVFDVVYQPIRLT